MGAEPRVHGDDAWEPPELFDGFRVLAPLGRGGMGAVYLGRDLALDRLVALKFMTTSREDATGHRRFLAEGRALARLHHPNVVGVFRIDEVRGHPFIAYEYVRGESLDSVLKPLRWQSALAISSMLASALAAAHEAGLIHRDVKPSNVMLATDGEAKLLDFGIAVETAAQAEISDAKLATREGRVRIAGGVHLTLPGHTVGTPRYWAPEQWRGQPATTATDVYGLGLVAYELLTGTLPHQPSSTDASSQSQDIEDVPPLDPSLAPAPFLAAIARCLKRDPADRFPTAKEAAREFARVETVFLPRGHAEAAVGPDRDLVTASWNRLAAAHDALAVRTYEIMFESRPDLRSLFPPDLAGQRSKLLHALNLALTGLNAPEDVAAMLEELGRRHIAYGVEPSHLEVFGKALRRAIAEMDPDWNDALDAAWEHAYGFVSAAMRNGMKNPAPPTPTPTPTPLPATFGEIVERPRTQYASSGNGSIAYQVFGNGPPDLVLLPSLTSQVEATWGHPVPARLLTELARFSRVMILDRRGCGLSDPLETDRPDMDGIVADIATVMHAAGSTRAIIVAGSHAGLAAIRMADTRPDLVQALVLVGAAPRLSYAPDYPAGRPAEFFDKTAEWLLQHWGEPVLAGLQTPTASGDPTYSAWLASYYRLATSPRRAVAGLRAFQDADVRDSLAKITAPTLVLHRRGDLATTLEQGRDLAAKIHGARFVELEGDDHFLLAGDVVGVAREIERFTASLAKTELAHHPT